MAGFTIHLAVAKQYHQKHPEEITNLEEFLKGTLAPDLNEEGTDTEKNKSKSHYGKWGNGEAEVHLDQFLHDPKVEMKQDFWKGYFLHLLTDYYFYRIFFAQEFTKLKEAKDNFYHDYDCLNTVLLPKYQITPSENLKKWMGTKEETPKYLKQEKVELFIEKMANISLKEQRKLIEEKGMEGLPNEYQN